MFGYCTGAMGAGGWIVMLAGWAAFLAAAVWAVTRFFPADGRRDRADDPIETQTPRQSHDELTGTGSR